MTIWHQVPVSFQLAMLLPPALALASDNHERYAASVGGLARIQRFGANNVVQTIRYHYYRVQSLLCQAYDHTFRRQSVEWNLVLFIAGCSLIQLLRLWRNTPIDRTGVYHETQANPLKRKHAGAGMDNGAKDDDPSLLRKNSSYKSFSTSFTTYPFIRVFYHPHPQAAKLPTKPTPLPLLVFIHGLGGSLSQFQLLLTCLANVAPCLGIDFPGCGLSDFQPRSWDAYTPEALAELANVVIEQYCDRAAGQGVVLISHSMGCSFSALLCSTVTSLHSRINYDILGLIAICPRASSPSSQQIATFKKLLTIPNTLFDFWRKWDRRGGPHSASVARFVGADTDLETRKLQMKFNAQSQTAVWRRMAWGALPKENHGLMSGGMPGSEIWAGIEIPLFLVAGEADTVTKPEEIAVIVEALSKADKPIPDSKSDIVPEAAAPSLPGSTKTSTYDTHSDDKNGLLPSTTERAVANSDEPIESQKTDDDDNSIEKLHVLKTSILPSPASHALLYDRATYRTLAGLIQSFLTDHVDSRLSLGWQLKYLATEGKWDVKNLNKWQQITPVSEPIGRIFRALKTSREIDESHSPSIFVAQWHNKIKAVIDISHESPVYNPQILDEGGIEYHKFPTVSKIPPTTEEVKDFIHLVDRLRNSTETASASNQFGVEDERLIGVHCHYGFNRTGFFMCCYLIEKEGFTVQQAIDEFQAHRPPGIRHEHFIDTLFVRYCMGLKRAPTM